MSVYRVILADCPWRYRRYGHRGHGAVAPKYPTLDQPALCALPVARLAADPCALFLWATGPKMPEALEVMAAWGFRYCCVAFTWHKEGNIGMGSYTRTSEEFVILGVRGSGMTKLRKSASVRSFVSAPRGEHSAKPEEVQDRIEALFDGPCVELFARRARPGWACWGNQVASDLRVAEALA